MELRALRERVGEDTNTGGKGERGGRERRAVLCDMFLSDARETALIQ